jgi:four helix bundle protein
MGLHHSIILKNNPIHGINNVMDRKNVNRGFKKLRVWQDAVALYVLACNIFTDFPFELKKVAANSIDAAHSVSRNIAEGYCRRSLKEYLNHLNIARGSCGEFHSCYFSCKQAQQITQDQYERLDQLHYKVENALLKLIESLQKKQTEKQWQDKLQPE